MGLTNLQKGALGLAGLLGFLGLLSIKTRAEEPVPECVEGMIEVISYCSDGVTPKTWNECINGVLVEQGQDCPIVEACVCNDWVNMECTDTITGIRKQRRTCNPSGCDIEEQNVSDPSCIEILPECVEGETKCVGMDQYKCVNGRWVLYHQNSPVCGEILCEGIVCPDICVGTNLYSQVCNPYTGKCEQSTIVKENAEECGYEPICDTAHQNKDHCFGYDLYKCSDGKWILVFHNAPECGFDYMAIKPTEPCPNKCFGYDYCAQKWGYYNDGVWRCMRDYTIEQNSSKCDYVPPQCLWDSEVVPEGEKRCRWLGYSYADAKIHCQTYHCVNDKLILIEDVNPLFTKSTCTKHEVNVLSDGSWQGVATCLGQIVSQSPVPTPQIRTAGSRIGFFDGNYAWGPAIVEKYPAFIPEAVEATKIYDPTAILVESEMIKKEEGTSSIWFDLSDTLYRAQTVGALNRYSYNKRFLHNQPIKITLIYPDGIVETREVMSADDLWFYRDTYPVGTCTVTIEHPDYKFTSFNFEITTATYGGAHYPINLARKKLIWEA